ncbi:DUF1616 domain-containing protein [Natrarchaeobius halalkaliphilus]|uniref:DUF1616 domain-containing protein n=1 Tax=Natrarchaeobius halalkaliphilus TaxID=1679091 RepID=A0A3N6LP89_9EURY|nr:DUF1616 domain-containing protein [Natrarchaeobius halalkaliphilus]RQG91238.1 DUF1616 domain-containing protein [Natrarchaeobius halalkaliphilus]
MSFGTETRTRLESVRRYPSDLAAVSVLAVFSYVVIASVPDGNVVRLFLVVPFALFLPGYAVASILFPAGSRDARETASGDLERRTGGIDLLERLGLSFALSLAVVPLVVLSVAVTEWGLGTESVAAGIGLVTIALAQIGVVRRLRTPESIRFNPSSIVTAIRARRDHESRLTLSSVLLVVAIGTAVGALLFGFFAPASAGGFTELGLYSETDDGELVAGEIPNEIEPGESVPVTVSVDNQEGDDREYAIVVQQQSVEAGEVTERTAVGEIELEVPNGETETIEPEITPDAAVNETVRISVLLYEDGDVPAIPTNENADQETYVWVTVTEDPEAADD